jgi:surfactin synthase thioesterase subunit
MTSSTSAKKNGTWVVPLGPERRGALRLICFPHAGASAPVFRSWSEVLDEAISVWGVQLPGRGVRLREPPLRSMGELVRALATAVSHQGDAPFAFFGHSMGGLVAFEVTRELRRRGAPAPRVLFVSGIGAPNIPTDRPRIHQLPKDDLLRRLRGLDGTPVELIEHPELMDSWLPTFRADLEVVETHTHQEEPPVAVPIRAFGGRDDIFVSRSELARWREQTTSGFTLRMLPGGHFFVETARTALLRAVGRELEGLLGSSPLQCRAEPPARVRLIGG